jgi:hypothetical protein
MDRAIWGVQSAQVVKILGNSPHFDHALTVVRCQAFDFRTSVLKPHLHLTWAEPWNFAGQPFAVSCIGMWLLCKLAHQKPGLLVRQSEALHLASLCGSLSRGLRLRLGVTISISLYHFLILQHFLVLLLDDCLAIISRLIRSRFGTLTGRRYRAQGV